MLTIQTFKQMATGFKTHKEEHGSIEQQDLLTVEEIEDLRINQFPFVSEELLHQVVVVRKGHRDHVHTMLEELVAFRQKNGWNFHIEERDLDQDVLDSGAHSIGTTDDDMPLVHIRLRKINLGVASAQDFQHEAQYRIQEASKKHSKGEIAVTLDFEKATVGILRHLSGDDLNRGMDIFGKYPVKVKRVYVTNASAVVRVTIKTVLAFASSKVQSKVIFR